MKWISVSERLPESKKRYLVRKEGHFCCSTDQIMIGIYEKYKERSFQWNDDCGRTIVVTHWMPLPPIPEPPKDNE